MLQFGFATGLRFSVLHFIGILSLFSTVAAQNEGSTAERRYACWGSFGPPVVSAQCPRDTVIHVTKAGLKVQTHGGTCRYNENDCGCIFGELGCNMPNVRDLCMGRPACRLDVTQQYINTDACRGFSDYMYIDFNCVPAQQNAIVDICSSTQQSSESGFIRSPNYPGASAYEQQCTCELSTQPYSAIPVNLLDFHAQTPGCQHNQLLIQHNGQSNKYCGEKPTSGIQINVESNKVSLTYSTDGQGSKGGFWLKFQAEPKATVNIKCKITKRSKPKKPITAVKPPKDNADENDIKKKTDRERSKKLSRIRERNKNMDEELEGKSKRTHSSVERESRRGSGRDSRRGDLDRTSRQDKDEKKGQSTPWWWKFTVKTKAPQASTTQFPPWFEEVDATEMPKWIKKTVKPETSTKPPSAPDTTLSLHDGQRSHKLVESMLKSKGNNKQDGRQGNPITNKPGIERSSDSAKTRTDKSNDKDKVDVHKENNNPGTTKSKSSQNRNNDNAKTKIKANQKRIKERPKKPLGSLSAPSPPALNRGNSKSHKYEKSQIKRVKQRIKNEQRYRPTEPPPNKKASKFRSERTKPLSQSWSHSDKGKSYPVAHSYSDRDKSYPVAQSYSDRDKSYPVAHSYSDRDKSYPVAQSNSDRERSYPMAQQYSDREKFLKNMPSYLGRRKSFPSTRFSRPAFRGNREYPKGPSTQKQTASSQNKEAFSKRKTYPIAKVAKIAKIAKVHRKLPPNSDKHNKPKPRYKPDLRVYISDENPKTQRKTKKLEKDIRLAPLNKPTSSKNKYFVRPATSSKSKSKSPTDIKNDLYFKSAPTARSNSKNRKGEKENERKNTQRVKMGEKSRFESEKNDRSTDDRGGSKVKSWSVERPPKVSSRSESKPVAVRSRGLPVRSTSASPPPGTSSESRTTAGLPSPTQHPRSLPDHPSSSRSPAGSAHHVLSASVSGNNRKPMVTTTNTDSTAFSQAKNNGRSRSTAGYANGNGLHANPKYNNRNKGQQGESTIVTIIAGCVIGSILLIIIIGIVVRFVINRADPNYAMRQNHKKECVMRRNAQMQRRGQQYQ